MRIAGLIGGIGPESTIQYYRQIVAGYRARTKDGSYPPVVVTSIDMTKMLTLMGEGRFAEVTEFLRGELWRLARAGAGFGVLTSNTPHLVFEELQELSPIPLISIVEVARAAAQARGLRRVGLVGTRFTMEGGFYSKVFSTSGIAVVAPLAGERAVIHERYMGELVQGVFRAETRAEFLAVLATLRLREGIDGVVLGGTELPLLLTEPSYNGLPVLDTTRLHAERIVAEILA